MAKLEVQSSRIVSVAVAAILSLVLAASAVGQTPAQRTPSETVREFYKALYEKRFREALAISIYAPAIEGLTTKEFDEFRPDFEAMARGADSIEVSGEQISGDVATVFVKVKDDNGTMQPSKADLIRSNGIWIVGNAEDQKAVQKAGKQYFFDVRLLAHEADAQEMMVRIVKAQLVYSSQNAGAYADLATLVKGGLLPPDISTPDSTGYRYHISLSGDKKSYSAGAEPDQYGRSGKVSFYLDSAGLIQKDVGGKPLSAPKK